MTRTATGATLAILDRLEPEAKAGWEAEELNLTEAIACSAAITSRTSAQASTDAQAIKLKELEVDNPDVYNETPADIRDRYNAGSVIP